jgi:hypothetical protein
MRGVDMLLKPENISNTRTSDESIRTEGKLQLLAIKTLSSHDELYKVVDFLNKTLKEHHLMFGLTKNNRDNTMTISIYEV